MDDVRKKVTKARSILVLEYPFWGSIALGLELRPVENMSELAGGPFATDYTHLFYDPAYVEKVSIRRLIAEVAHECSHIVFNHNVRKLSRDHRKWNIAGDLAINPLLKDAGFDVGDDWLLEDQYRDMSADEIYSKLPHQKKGGGSGGSGQGHQGQGKYGDHSDGCGGMLEPKPKPGQTKEQAVAEAKQRARDMLAKAYTMAKAAGKVPAGVERYVEATLYPKIDWADELRHFVEVVTRDDYSWLHPNRRFAGSKFIMPSLHDKKMGEIVVAVDTSGSISQNQLTRFASELSGVLEMAQPKAVHVVYCDAGVASVEEFGPDDMPLRLRAQGGGGTSFTPVAKWVEENDMEPVCLIYFSDMICHDFPPEPNYPWLWAQVGNYNNKPPFGEVLIIDD